jgi:hypothetical protein
MLIIGAALVVALFLLWILVWEKKISDEVREVYAVLARLTESLKTSQQAAKDLRERLVEAQQKLFDYMDLTRKEALDSYRRGLQDGLLATERKPAYAPRNPVKTMEEHVTEVKESKEQAEANKAFMDGFNSIMTYTGDIPKGE